MTNSPANTVAIAIFAKTIGLSSVKTRLAKTIGQQKAEQFYQLSLECTQASLQPLVETASIYWALAEEEATELSQWQTFNTLWTGDGGLDQRLHHVYSTLKQRYDTVILIGSDCPTLHTSTIKEAIERLQLNPQQHIIGPCEDGGFYLFASTHALDKSLWLNVQYSQSDTRLQLIQQLKRTSTQTIYLLPSHYDIDTLPELQQLKDSNHLQNTQSQHALRTWLENNI